ncbi:MAG: class I SAM-dependent methyltransferase [Candidatus Omnitrophica bacterium]|nr:class I SAM-dependent methyltransferase [Candidatus Omnitrophota bacterium]
MKTTKRVKVDNNRQIEAYLKDRGLKEHEKELLSIIARDHRDFSGNVLDLGCASGTFIKAMHDKWPDAEYTGVDISGELIDISRKKLAGVSVNLIVQDITRYKPAGKFDIIIASGILSCFEDFESVLGKWTSWLKKSGRLYIFGRFNSCDIDTKIIYRNNRYSRDWEKGLIVYSVDTVKRYLEGIKLKHDFKRFYLNIDIQKNENPIRTYTARCVDGSVLVINGANTIAEQFFLTIRAAE